MFNAWSSIKNKAQNLGNMAKSKISNMMENQGEEDEENDEIMKLFNQ